MEELQQPDAAQSLDNFFNLSFDANSLAQLKQTALWAKICSITAFASYLISLVLVIFSRSRTDAGLGEASTEFHWGTVFGTLLVALFGGIINYFLYRFAVAVGQGAESMDGYKVNTGFNSLRIYFRILGIVVIVGLSFLLLAIVIILISPARY